MRILVIGKGAREHALVWKLRRSPLCEELYVWPGNSAMAREANALELAADADFDELTQAARRHGVGLVVCGPETPLADGLADRLEAEGIPVFGPRQAASRLEASKAFAKDFMAKANIPTAGYQLVSSAEECRRAASKALKDKGGVVLKASGLASGKGVFVCRTDADVEEALGRLYETSMKSAASTVVVEELMNGRECSYFVFLGHGAPTGLGFAVDFKRLQDGDKGPNTGGMGCYAPTPWLPDDAAEQVNKQIVQPLVDQLAASELPYQGCLYLGLMWTDTGPQVVEFNIRLGDPEAQVMAVYDPRDWLALMAEKAGVTLPQSGGSAGRGEAGGERKAVALVMASEDYPYGETAVEAADLPEWVFDAAEDRGTVVFGGSVGGSAGALQTGRGRVLTVVGYAVSFAEARRRAYEKVDEIQQVWPQSQVRRDIAARLVEEGY